MVSPLLLTIESGPGAPMLLRPQRTIHSLKPFSQPMPPFSKGWMKSGWTGSLTGESQQRLMSPSFPFQIPIPRVSNTEKESLPLLISTRLTPSCLPPRRMRVCTDQPCLLPVAMIDSSSRISGIGPVLSG